MWPLMFSPLTNWRKCEKCFHDIFAILCCIDMSAKPAHEMFEWIYDLFKCRCFYSQFCLVIFEYHTNPGWWKRSQLGQRRILSQSPVAKKKKVKERNVLCYVNDSWQRELPSLLPWLALHHSRSRALLSAEVGASLLFFFCSANGNFRNYQIEKIQLQEIIKKSYRKKCLYFPIIIIVIIFIVFLIQRPPEPPPPTPGIGPRANQLNWTSGGQQGWKKPKELRLHQISKYNVCVYCKHIL